MQDLPEDVAGFIKESKAILDVQQEAVRQRMEFLLSASECLSDVVKPAAEEFKQQFENTGLKIEIKDPAHPLTPELTITAQLETFPCAFSFDVGFRYRPTETNAGLEFATRPDEADWISIVETPLADVSRESVLSRLARELARHLKRRFVPKETRESAD